MQIKIRQTIFKSVFDREFLEETINSNIIPNTGDYVKIGNINGRVDYKIIDYNTNDITIQIVSGEWYKGVPENECRSKWEIFRNTKRNI